MSLEEIVQEESPDIRELRSYRDEIYNSLGVVLPRSVYEVSQWYDEHREELQEEFVEQGSEGDDTDDESNDGDNE